MSDGTYTTSYVYDTANQLVRENNQELNKTWTWTYDAAGNILSRKEYAYTTGTLGTPTDTVSYGYATSGWKDLLTSYDGFSYSYDTIGNPLFDGFWTYTWEHGRELGSQYRIIALPDGRQMDVGISYVYDVNGMRTQKSILTRWFAGTTSAPVEYMTDEQYDYVYNGSSLSQLKVTKETTAGNGSPTTATESLNFTYDASGTPMTVTHNGTTYYYVTNLQGDVTDILNSAGTAVVSYTYDAWGNIRSTTGTLSTTLGKYNPQRYRGYVYDTDTKFYYLQSRYYNPDVGRFLNADAFVSTGQSFEGNNMFAYCLNNPVSRIDISGMHSVDCQDDDGEIFSSDDLEEHKGSPSSNSYSPPSHSPSGSNYTQNNFRRNLQKFTGESGEGEHAHHTIPKEFADPAEKIGINVHDPKYGSFVDAQTHLKFSNEYNAIWRDFFASGNVTQEAALMLGRELAQYFGYIIYY